MTKRDDKAGSPLPPTKTFTHEQFTELLSRLNTMEDQLSQLFACHRFYCDAMQSFTEPVTGQESSWHLGVLLVGNWLNDAREQALTDLNTTQQWLAEGARLQASP